MNCSFKKIGACKYQINPAVKFWAIQKMRSRVLRFQTMKSFLSSKTLRFYALFEMGRVLRFTRLRNNYWLATADILTHKMTKLRLWNVEIQPFTFVRSKCERAVINLRLVCMRFIIKVLSPIYTIYVCYINPIKLFKN